MDPYHSEEPLTSTTRPLTDSIITVRLVKSFPYRAIKNHVFHHVDITSITPKQFLELIKEEIAKDGKLRPYRTCVDKLDTLKIYTHAHGSKTMNLAINFDHDEDWILNLNNDQKTLRDYGVENETEISCFNMEEYLEFKKDPKELW